jgi:hypothetical protein
MKVFLVSSVLLLVILGVIFGPFLIIWAVNTLFSLTIPFTLKTWFAVLILHGAVSAHYSSKS